MSRQRNEPFASFPPRPRALPSSADPATSPRVHGKKFGSGAIPSLNLIAACDPSQNGLFFEAPQRHRVTRLQAHVETVRAHQAPNASPHPEAAETALGRVLDESKRRLVMPCNVKRTWRCRRQTDTQGQSRV